MFHAVSAKKCGFSRLFGPACSTKTSSTPQNTATVQLLKRLDQNFKTNFFGVCSSLHLLTVRLPLPPRSAQRRRHSCKCKSAIFNRISLLLRQLSSLSAAALFCNCCCSTTLSFAARNSTQRRTYNSQLVHKAQTSAAQIRKHLMLRQ